MLRRPRKTKPALWLSIASNKGELPIKVKRKGIRRRPTTRLQVTRSLRTKAWWIARDLFWKRVGRNAKCACGCGRRAVDPHHIAPRSLRPDLVCVQSNLLPICRPCHKKVHDYRNKDWAVSKGFLILTITPTPKTK